MPRISDLTEWKKIHIPLDGRCTNCGKIRGTNPTQWTLIPGHMYCKYCFMANVSSKEEQQKLRQEFIESLREGKVDTEISIEHRVIEIHDMVKMLFEYSRNKELLTIQFAQMQSAEAARRHVRARLSIEYAEETIGRYLIGPELIAKHGDRLDYLIETVPLSLVKGMNAVVTTPAIFELHNELVGKTTPPWLERGMALYTNDEVEYSTYSAAYVQLLARQLS